MVNKHETRETCYQCGGSGIYAWGGSINGKPRHHGTCYRCQGKGHQTTADDKRNNYYDNHIRRFE